MTGPAVFKPSSHDCHLSGSSTPDGLAAMTNERRPIVLKVISGGQTGVDRAALDVALELGLPCGGWCPKGRKAEDGRIAPQYPLQETPSVEYEQRTEWNVRDSDGTLVLTRGRPTEGTAFTIDMARRWGRPCLVIDLAAQAGVPSVRDWAQDRGVRTLNVAGPRESKSPGVYAHARVFLHQLLSL